MQVEVPSQLPLRLVVQRLRERASDKTDWLLTLFPDDSLALADSIDAPAFTLTSVPVSIVSFRSLAVGSGDIEARGAGCLVRFRTRPTWHALSLVAVGALLAAFGLLLGFAAVGVRDGNRFLSTITPFCCAAAGASIAYVAARGARQEQQDLVSVVNEAAGI